MTSLRAAAATLAAAAVFAGCASGPKPATEPVAGSPFIAPERSARGNPPFYEVMGKRYYVLPTSDGYRERGVASWYGPDFHGRPTSSGEIYDMHAMTAAHPTLPLPTWVEVTHLGNGKRIIVRVNDRGPFLHNRIIDLSYAAARAIDMVGPGTALVEVRALGAPAGASADGSALLGTPAEPGAPAGDRPSAAAQRLFVQVGAFGERSNAERMQGRIERAGLGPVLIQTDASREPAIHRVRVGPIADVPSFDATVDALAAIGIEDTRLVTD